MNNQALKKVQDIYAGDAAGRRYVAMIIKSYLNELPLPKVYGKAANESPDEQCMGYKS